MVARGTVRATTAVTSKVMTGSGGGAGGGGSSYDTDAQTYFTAVEAADGEALETGVKDAINAFVVGCKDDGIWDAIKASCILAGARTLDGALVPLAGTAPTNVNFVSGDYSRTAGLTGNGSTKHLDTNYALGTALQNNRHEAVYVTTIATGSYLGASLASDSFTVRNQINVGVGDLNKLSTLFADATPSISTANQNAIGLIGLSRAVDSSYTRRGAGVNETVSVSSLSGNELNLHVFRRNRSATQNYSASRIAFYSAGESLNLAQLDTRVSTLITAIGAALA